MKARFGLVALITILIASCGGSGSNGGNKGYDIEPQRQQQQSPAQNSRYVTDESCRVVFTYTDAYGNPTRYDLTLTTYYSDGTQMSMGRVSNVPC